MSDTYRVQKLEMDDPFHPAGSEVRVTIVNEDWTKEVSAWVSVKEAGKYVLGQVVEWEK